MQHGKSPRHLPQHYGNLGSTTRRIANLVLILSIILALENIYGALVRETEDKEVIPAGIEYATKLDRSNQKQTRTFDYSKRLEFVHIPKTGGASIEKVMSDHGISWGFCKFVNRKESRVLSNGAYQCPGDSKYAISWLERFPGLLPIQGDDCLPWHVPSHFFDGLLSPEFNPYYKASLFAVVRNPYERILSEYYYRGTIVLQWKETQLNSAQWLNKWVRSNLKNRVKFVNHSYPWRMKDYCFAQGHFIPQRQFIYRGVDKRVVDHVLRFENLAQEFEDLLALYGYHNVSLKTSKQIFKTKKKLGVQNMTRGVRHLIELVYAQDFEEFGYPILPS